MIIKTTNCNLIFNDSLLEEIDDYKDKVKENKIGSNLKNILHNNNLKTIDLLYSILQTKEPQIYAESQVKGNGEDWNLQELKILGSICAAFNVQVFDDGRHSNPKKYNSPLKMTYIFVPGALFRNGFNKKYAPERDLLYRKEIDENKYNIYYLNKLDPVFKYINKVTKEENKKAFVSIPGIGCGQFAGEFKGLLGEKFKNALINTLKINGSAYSHIDTLHYDPYNECTNEEHLISEVKLNVRPYCLGEGSPQLSIENTTHINNFEKKYKFFSLVAWDHVSWPGNDFYSLNRITDDGVKAAASNLMSIITNINGNYISSRYVPIDPYINWNDCINKNNILQFWGSPII